MLTLTPTLATFMHCNDTAAGGFVVVFEIGGYVLLNISCWSSYAVMLMAVHGQNTAGQIWGCQQ